MLKFHVAHLEPFGQDSPVDAAVSHSYCPSGPTTLIPADAQDAACCWLTAESLLRHCPWPNKLLHPRLHPLLEGSVHPMTHQYLECTGLAPLPQLRTSQKAQLTKPSTCKSPSQSPFPEEIQPCFPKQQIPSTTVLCSTHSQGSYAQLREHQVTYFPLL